MEQIDIELTTQEYTDLEVRARRSHMTPWLFILETIRRKIEDDDDQDGEDWRKT